MILELHNIVHAVNIYFLMLKIVRDLNEYNKINLNEMRRKNMQDDAFFIFSQHSDLDVDNDVVSIDS